MGERFDGDWSRMVVISAANYWHGVRYQDRHIGERLADLGYSVLYVDPPLSCVTVRNHPKLAEALEGPRLRWSCRRLRDSPRSRFPVRCGPACCASPRPSCGTGSQRQRAGRATTVAEIATWPGLDIFTPRHEALRIFWAQDDLAGGADLLGTDAQHLAAVRNGLLRRATRSSWRTRWSHRVGSTVGTTRISFRSGSTPRSTPTSRPRRAHRRDGGGAHRRVRRSHRFTHRLRPGRRICGAGPVVASRRAAALEVRDRPGRAPARFAERVLGRGQGLRGSAVISADDRRRNRAVHRFRVQPGQSSS